MDRRSLARWRLHRLLLRGSTAQTPGGVIDALAVSQGQDYLPAIWSMAQRTDAPVTRDEVGAAFDRGELLRTHVLRPTWHLVAPRDIRWLLTATAPRVHKLNAYYYRQLGVDDATVRTVRATLERVLPGRHLTRTEIGDEVAAAGIEARGNRLGYLMMYAELEAWVCSGARSGNKQTYALLAERAPDDGRSREQALYELARVYFSTRGPATVKDLAAWASLTVSEARLARTTLVGFDDVEVEGRTYVVCGDPPAEQPEGPVVDLVQAYDECIMSYSESRDVLSTGHRWTEGPPSSYLHAILLDGQLIGHWRYDRDAKGRPDTVQTFTYRPLAADEKDALGVAVAQFAEFVGGPVTWT